MTLFRVLSKHQFTYGYVIFDRQNRDLQISSVLYNILTFFFFMKILRENGTPVNDDTQGKYNP